jgi:hypothetical protein
MYRRIHLSDHYEMLKRANLALYESPSYNKFNLT